MITKIIEDDGTGLFGDDAVKTKGGLTINSMRTCIVYMSSEHEILRLF